MKEMSNILGSAATPIGSDPGSGGGAGGNAASSPGPTYPWVGSVGGVSTATGNKLTTISTVGWTVRGSRLAVDLTLYHNSERTIINGSRGAKWTLFYDSGLNVDASGNVKMSWGDGRVYILSRNVDGSYSPPPGIHDRLIANGNPVASYDLITQDQTKYHFTPFGSSFLLTTITDENGNFISVNRAVNNGGTNSISDSTGRQVTFGYNSTYYTSITDPLNRTFSFGFDGNGNLQTVTYPVVNGTSYSVTLGYDGNHNVNSYKDPRGNISTSAYNSDNSIAWEQDAYGSRTSFYYGIDFNGNPNSADTRIVDANGHVTLHTYSAGRLASVTDALQYTEYYTYDAANNVTQKQDRNGNPWNYTYDGMGNVLTAKDPYGNTTTYTYNSHNRLLTATLPLGRSVALTYDYYDNPTQAQQKDASGNVLATTKLTIGTYGLVSDKYDANSHHTAYTYDGNGYLATVTTPLGHKTQWTYDALGFQTSRTDAMGRNTAYTPDAWERLVTTTYPDGSAHTFSYDPDGNLLTWSDAATGTWSRAYDADDRLTAERNSNNGPTLLISHAYDASGQKGLLSTTSDYTGRTISYGYTARNELAGLSEPGNTETYAYDANGNQTHRYLPNGLRTDQYYNSDGTLHSYYDWDGGSNILASYGYGYNADHQMTLCSGARNYSTSGGASSSNVTYGYDGLGHLSSDSRTNTYAYGKTYTVDGANNRLTQNENGCVTTLAYDADDELNSATNTSVYGYTYNANGDQITSTVAGQGTTYTYDFDDQLTGITKSGSTTTFQYDALGRQFARTVNGVFTHFYYDGGSVLFEASASGAMVTYLWGNGLVRRGSEYPMTDGLGSTKLVTNSGGATTGTQDTEAFGRTMGGTGSSASPYGYHGAEGYRQDGDGPAGMEPYQKVGARYYDATFGRFITRDTDLTQSPYAYCDGDPINFSDPSGHLHVGGGIKPPTYIGPSSSGDPNSYGGAPGGSDPGGASSPNGPGPVSGSGSGPDGSGGTVTVSTSGGGSVSDTQNHQTITLSGLGGPTQTLTDTTGASLGHGFSVTGTEILHLGNGAGSQSLGFGYSGGGFSLGFTFSSNGSSNGTFGFKGSF